jgi:hypothetical protein
MNRLWRMEEALNRAAGIFDLRHCRNIRHIAEFI